MHHHSSTLCSEANEKINHWTMILIDYSFKHNNRVGGVLVCCLRDHANGKPLSTSTIGKALITNIWKHNIVEWVQYTFSNIHCNNKQHPTTVLKKYFCVFIHSPQKVYESCGSHIFSKSVKYERNSWKLSRLILRDSFNEKPFQNRAGQFCAVKTVLSCPFESL